MKTRAIPVVLMLLVLSFAGAAPRHRHRVVHRHKGDAKTLKHHLTSIRQKKHDVRKQLNKTRHDLRVVRGDLHQIDDRLGSLEDDLHTTESRLSDSRSEQRSLGKSLEKATAQLKEARERARMRLRDMYMHGNRTVVAALVGSTSYSDFLTRRFINKRIADKDRQVFEDYDRLRTEVADRKHRADRLVVKVAGLARDERNEQRDLQGTRDQKGELLSQLRSKQSSLEQVIRELDDEQSTIEAEIASYNRGRGRSSSLVPYTGKFLRPASGPITSGFGMRYHPILHRNRMHTGIDFGARRGSPIRATADGVVISAGYSRGYGNRIILAHGGRISTLYGHCSRLFVTTGETVHRGQKIAAVGSTGLATGPHLHFEVRVNGKPVNPRKWL